MSRKSTRQAVAHPRGTSDGARLLEIMTAAAREAAAYIASRAPEARDMEWRTKTPSDFVSDVDTGAESLIREILLGGAHADAAFLGEESAPHQQAGAGLTFVVDPLDGTTNFLHGYPTYSVSIAALMDGALLAGVVHHAVTHEVSCAVAGEGAYGNGERLRVSHIDDPSRALIGTGFPFKHHDLIDRYMQQLPRILRGSSGVRRAGSAALDLADVARGRLDAFWELRLAPWDVAAGILLVREAGGLVTDLAGGDARVTEGPIVAGNPALHPWLLRTLRD